MIGYFYYQYKQTLHRHRRTVLYQILWHLSYVMTFVLCLIGIYFYEHDMEKGLLSAFLGAVLKHIYGPILGVLLVGIFFRYGHFIHKWYNYGLYRVLGRLSFSVYMVHVTVLSVLISGQRFPLEINNATLNAFTFGVYCIRYVKRNFNKIYFNIFISQSRGCNMSCFVYRTASSCHLQDNREWE